VLFRSEAGWLLLLGYAALYSGAWLALAWALLRRKEF
jgi:heme A synthase